MAKRKNPIDTYILQTLQTMFLGRGIQNVGQPIEITYRELQQQLPPAFRDVSIATIKRATDRLKRQGYIGKNLLAENNRIVIWMK